MRRPVAPSGTNLLGLVKHLAAVDDGWFCETFGRETEPVPFDDDDPQADMRVAFGETTDEIIAFHHRAREASNAVVAAHDIDDIGTAWTGEAVSLRWVMIHMLEEWAGHAGHIDMARELIDGMVGDHDRS